MYQITIRKFEKRSPEEVEKIENSRKYNRDFPVSDTREYPNFIDRDKYVVVRELESSITDEEFAAVKKAVLSVM